MKTQRLFVIPMFWAIAVLVLVDLVIPAQHLLATQESKEVRPSNRQERREKQLQEFLREHSDDSGNPRLDLWLKGVQDAKQMKVVTTVSVARASASPDSAISVVGVQWTQIGPAPLRIDDNTYQGDGPDSGRVDDIAIDPRGAGDQVIYIAASSGGIWKSTDGGLSWTPKTD